MQPAVRNVKLTHNGAERQYDNLCLGCRRVERLVAFEAMTASSQSRTCSRSMRRPTAERVVSEERVSMSALIGTLNRLCAVLPPLSKVAAMPDDATATAILRSLRKAARSALNK